MDNLKERTKSYVRGLDKPLLGTLAVWYVAHYYYTIQNKAATYSIGGERFSMLLATSELLVGALYAIFLWVAPDARQPPRELTANDVGKLFPAGICIAGQHAASVFGAAVGGVVFAQIVKATEPAFVAVIGTLFYKKKLTLPKWMTLIPIVGGIWLCVMKQNPKGDFEWDYTPGALIGAVIANIFAAFRSAESSKIMGEDAAVVSRLGSVGNQFAVMMILAVIVMIPLAMVTQGAEISAFVDLLRERRDFQQTVICAGLSFYAYNELSNMSLRKLSPVGTSIATTARHAVGILGACVLFQERLTGRRALGCAVCLGGVFLHSIADKLVEALKKQKKVAKE